MPPLIPHLRGVRTFAEPCCGEGAWSHLESYGLRCVHAGDIATGQDALAVTDYGKSMRSSPTRRTPARHARADRHFQPIAPAWLLIDLDWASTKQAIPVPPQLQRHRPHRPGAVDRRDQAHGKENFGWYRFDVRHKGGPVFHARGRHRQHPAAAARNAARPTDHRVRTRFSVLMPADSVPIASG